MSISQRRSKRKISGGRYRKSVKKLCNLGDLPTFTKLEDKKIKEKRTRAGHRKVISLSNNKINVIDPKTKKAKVAEIKSVVKTPANRHFVRRNILTKGAIVDTSLGKVKITSRPGQEPILNGIPVKE